VIVEGDVLGLEYRDVDGLEEYDVSPGRVDSEEPTDRVHRAINIGRRMYEQITVFFLDRPDAGSNAAFLVQKGRGYA